MKDLKYHHIGIPTDVPRPGEVYLEEFKVHTSGFDSSPFGVEWMRFEPGSPLPELVRTVPHVAFVVDDLEAAISGHELLIPPNSPSEGVTVAFIVQDGAPIEFLKFDAPDLARRRGRRGLSRVPSSRSRSRRTCSGRRCRSSRGAGPGRRP